MLEYINKVAGFKAWRTGNHAVFDRAQNCYRKSGKFDLKGKSDITGIAPDGKIIAIEVKTKTGKLSVEQVAFLDMIKRYGGYSTVCRSLDDAIEFVRGIQNGLCKS